MLKIFNPKKSEKEEEKYRADRTTRNKPNDMNNHVKGKWTKTLSKKEKILD